MVENVRVRTLLNKIYDALQSYVVTKADSPTFYLLDNVSGKIDAFFRTNKSFTSSANIPPISEDYSALSPLRIIYQSTYTSLEGKLLGLEPMGDIAAHELLLCGQRFAEGEDWT